jgi:hypothetical protein
MSGQMKNHLHRSTAAATAALFALTLTARAVAWDSFQSYADNQVLATNATILMGDGSSPWTRFGNASSNPYARAAFGPYGDTVCHYSLTWGTVPTDNWGILAYHFAGPQDLSATPGLSVKLMTPALPPITNTFVQAEFEDASGNVWRTKPALAPVLSVANSWQTYTFDFNASNMFEVSGTDPFSLSAVIDVRIRFENDSGDNSSQTIYLDDFESYSAAQPVVVWDGFQSYTNGQVLATNTAAMGDGSSPWGRFGVAVGGNPTARTGFGPYLDIACDFPLGWSATASNATLICNFSSATNLIALPGFSVRLMTTALTPVTNTLLYAEFQDSTATIWRSTFGQPIAAANIWQTFTFKFASSVMTRVSGSSPFDISGVTQVRLRFVNTSLASSTQHIYVYNFGSPLTNSSIATVWDNFLAYTNNEVLASTIGAQPSNAPSMWGYFGGAAADKVFAKTALGPNSDIVGDTPLKYSLGNNASVIHYFNSLSNLTSTPGFSIRTLITNLTAVTNTLVFGQFEQTNANVSVNTIWQSVAGLPLTTTSIWQTLVFNFSPATMVRAQGTNDFDLTAVRDVRLKFVNTGGDTTSQHTYFTDLRSYAPKPAVTVVPRPQITSINVGPANAVTLQFTCSDNSPASNFQLWWSPAVADGANWQQDTGAVITSIGTGLYQVVTTGPADTAFYRIRH